MIRDLIVNCVKNTGKYQSVTVTTPLRGDKSPLDSLAFVGLMVDVTNELSKARRGRVDIFKPEYFLGKKDNPYETVGSLVALAERLTDAGTVVAPEQERPVKVIFTDLDGTLWDGISGEGEVMFIKPLVNELLRLQESGVLLVLVTKNYRDIVMTELKGLPTLLDKFVACHYNVQDKAACIRRICTKLNIGMDSAVFLDDSEHERDRVRTALPEVRVFDNHMDIAKITIERVTEEDRNRTEMYRQEFERASSKPHSDSTDDYMAWLTSLGMVLTVKKAETESELARANELIDRSNQFNFGKYRPDGNYDTYVFSLKDKFGDMGIIATANITSNKFIHNFCVSCRALGRGVEHVINDHVFAGFDWCYSSPPLNSGKNMAAIDFYNFPRGLQRYPIKVIEA